MRTYSVPTAYGVRDVLVKGFVDKVAIICGADEIARHSHFYGRGQFVFIRRRPGKRGNPRPEAAPEFFRVERGKNIAEVIMRGRSIAKRPEPAQETDLLLAEPRDVDKRLPPPSTASKHNSITSSSG